MGNSISITTIAGLALAINIASIRCLAVEAESSAGGNSGEDRKTAAEWLPVVQAQNVECKKYEEEHPEETSILYGATQLSPGYRGMQFFPKWPKEYQDGYKAYLAWWTQEGEAAFKKWREAGFPITTDKDYWLLSAIAMNEFGKNGVTKDDIAYTTINPSDSDLVKYRARVIERGKEIFLKGCSGKKLSTSELTELRLLAMDDSWIYADGDYRFCRPSHFGLYSDPICFNPYDPNKSHSSAIGTMAPDFTLPRMEEILARPSYSNETRPFDEMNIFRPAILIGVLEIMNGYEANPAGARSPYPIQAKPYDHEFKDPVTLSSFRGKKPVLLTFAGDTDTWCWCSHVAPLFGPLYQAIKDKVEVFFVDTTVHDMLMCPDPFGSTFFIPGQRAIHPTATEMPLETRARKAKICYMNYPALAVPYLLDDLGEHALNAYQADGGEAVGALVDKNGTISYCQSNLQCNESLSLDGIGEGYPMARNQRTMNMVESNLKVLLDAGGVWNKGMKFVVPDWKTSPFMENVTLTSVNVSGGTITIADKDNNHLTLAVDGQTRIMLGQKQSTLANLKAGMTVSILYCQKVIYCNDPQAPAWMARLIATPDAYDNYWGCWGDWRHNWWVPAIVQSINSDKGTIQAKLTLTEQDSPGLAFWKSASPGMIKTLGDGSNCGGMAAETEKGFKLLTPNGGRTLTLHTDRATELFLDGTPAKVSDLEPGDRLGFDLGDFQSNDVLPDFIRVYRY